MGIDNRDYMYESADTFGTVRGHEIRAVTLFLIINVLVWFVWQFERTSDVLAAFLNSNFLCSIDLVFHRGFVHTLLTCAISHIEPYHILFNMLFFWYLGRDVEAFYGRRNFVVLYVFAAVMCSLAQLGLNFLRGTDVPMLGASGSVMGVAVVAAFLYPSKPMTFWFFPIKLWQLVALYVVLDLCGVVRGGFGVANAGHLGGALAGLMFHRMDLRLFASRGRKQSGILYRLKTWWRRRRFRTIEGRVERPITTQAQRDHLRESWNRPRVDSESAQRVDELLAKISQKGMGALSNEEREFLQSASEKYKKR